MIRLIIWCKPFSKYILAIWFLAIISVSSIPSIPTLKIHVAESEIRLDYIIHFCEYGFLAGMAFLTFVNFDFKINFKKFLFTAIILVIFGIADEYHQKFIPGRSFNIRDIMSNISGILGALVFCIIVFRKISEKRDSSK